MFTFDHVLFVYFIHTLRFMTYLWCIVVSAVAPFDVSPVFAISAGVHLTLVHAPTSVWRSLWSSLAVYCVPSARLLSIVFAMCYVRRRCVILIALVSAAYQFREFCRTIFVEYRCGCTKWNVSLTLLLVSIHYVYNTLGFFSMRFIWLSLFSNCTLFVLHYNYMCALK